MSCQLLPSSGRKYTEYSNLSPSESSACHEICVCVVCRRETVWVGVELAVAAGGSPVSVTVTEYAEPELTVLAADLAALVPTTDVTERLRTLGGVFCGREGTETDLIAGGSAPCHSARHWTNRPPGL